MYDLPPEILIDIDMVSAAGAAGLYDLDMLPVTILIGVGDIEEGVHGEDIHTKIYTFKTKPPLF